jgi:hypothetical protein
MSFTITAANERGRTVRDLVQVGKWNGYTNRQQIFEQYVKWHSAVHPALSESNELSTVDWIAIERGTVALALQTIQSSKSNVTDKYNQAIKILNDMHSVAFDWFAAATDSDFAEYCTVRDDVRLVAVKYAQRAIDLLGSSHALVDAFGHSYKVDEFAACRLLYHDLFEAFDAQPGSHLAAEVAKIVVECMPDVGELDAGTAVMQVVTASQTGVEIERTKSHITVLVLYAHDCGTLQNNEKNERIEVYGAGCKEPAAIIDQWSPGFARFVVSDRCTIKFTGIECLVVRKYVFPFVTL